jgi:hypothetical protein
MRYCYVENGVINNGPMNLPKNWENISNFSSLSHEQLISLGWLPYRFVAAVVPENSVIIDPTIVIESDEVVEYQNYRAKTQQEIDNDNQGLWISIRSRRNELLKDCDWTQIADSPLNQTLKQEWATYRQELRDLPEVYSNPNDVVWPTEPGS